MELLMRCFILQFFLQLWMEQSSAIGQRSGSSAATKQNIAALPSGNILAYIKAHFKVIHAGIEFLKVNSREQGVMLDGMKRILESGKPGQHSNTNQFNFKLSTPQQMADLEKKLEQTQFKETLVI